MRLIAVMAVTALLASCDRDAAARTDGGPVTTSGSTTEAAAAANPGQRRFRDWLTACDNVGMCHAFAPAAENVGWVRMTIPAGPDGSPSVLVGFWPEDGAFEGPMTVRVDETVFDARIDRNPDAPSYAAVSADRARDLIDAMAQGRTMSLQSGSETVPISLSGAAASLLWIDEQQGRLGTSTALLRRGSRPASSVPAAAAAPVIVAAPPVSQAGYGDQEGQTLPAAIEALPAVRECRAETAFNPDLQKVISSARLDARTVLWSVPCGLGAYNFANAYFTARPDGSQPQRVTFPAGSGKPEALLVNSAYDPATRVMDAFNKGRGLGDCGEAASWTWTTEGFVLRSASEMPECWGVPSAFWPASWVSQ